MHRAGMPPVSPSWTCECAPNGASAVPRAPDGRRPTVQGSAVGRQRPDPTGPALRWRSSYPISRLALTRRAGRCVRRAGRARHRRSPRRAWRKPACNAAPRWRSSRGRIAPADTTRRDDRPSIGPCPDWGCSAPCACDATRVRSAWSPMNPREREEVPRENNSLASTTLEVVPRGGIVTIPYKDYP